MQTIQNNSLIKLAYSDQLQSRQRNTCSGFGVFFPRKRPHEANLPGSPTVADTHKSLYVYDVCWAHSEDRGIMWDYLCASDNNQTDMKRTQHSCLPIPSAAPQIILSLFFSPFWKGFYLFTASRNFHYIVVPLHGSYFKHACHQQIWAKVHHGEELHLQGCCLWVLFSEQTSLNLLFTPKRQQLAEAVRRGSSSVCMSLPHHG